MSANESSATCTLSTAGTVQEVTVANKCKVTYEFDTSTTAADLALPYAVAVDGKILPRYQDKPGVLTKTKRNIELLVDPGSKTELYLNSDVHPDHRRAPIFPIEVGKDDVLMKITERLGRIGRGETALRGPLCRTGPKGKRLEVYETELTGDVWMAISHLYTATEAAALIPADTDPAIRDAISQIFSGLAEPQLTVIFATTGSAPASRLVLRFMPEMQNNVRKNTTICPWLSGILPRTHPRAFAALIAAAKTAQVSEVHVTSSWRPCMGSIAHRAGLGLDINYVEAGQERITIFRSLVPRKPHDPGQGGSDAAQEPDSIRTLREALSNNIWVRQVFEPWSMDAETRDRMSPLPNRQLSPNERLHHDHLHITALEPKILP